MFAALDLRNGRSVAIKQISLHDIDREELQAIEVRVVRSLPSQHD